MKLEFEYGQGLVGAELPVARIFIRGDGSGSPVCQDWEPVRRYPGVHPQPIGMPPLKELAGPGKSVVIVIPDIVKGATSLPATGSHRACLDGLYAAGGGAEGRAALFSTACTPGHRGECEPS